jgi:hypothetical protein
VDAGGEWVVAGLYVIGVANTAYSSVSGVVTNVVGDSANVRTATGATIVVPIRQLEPAYPAKVWFFSKYENTK